MFDRWNGKNEKISNAIPFHSSKGNFIQSNDFNELKIVSINIKVQYDF